MQKKSKNDERGEGGLHWLQPLALSIKWLSIPYRPLPTDIADIGIISAAAKKLNLDKIPGSQVI